MPHNILQLKFNLNLPKAVYILAPGWNGRDSYKRIPADAFVIAVNKAVTIPGVHKHIWMAEDMGLVQAHPWFVKLANKLISENNPLLEPSPTPVFGEGKPTEMFPNVLYSYPSGPSMSMRPKYQINPNYLRGGCSIASKALQLAVIKGVKRVVLVGVDMHGRKYFDGTETASTMIKGDKWWCIDKFNAVIDNVKRRHGVSVVSLSPTALKIPVTGG